MTTFIRYFPTKLLYIIHLCNNLCLFKFIIIVNTICVHFRTYLLSRFYLSILSTTFCTIVLKFCLISCLLYDIPSDFLLRITEDLTLTWVMTTGKYQTGYRWCSPRTVYICFLALAITSTNIWMGRLIPSFSWCCHPGWLLP